MSNKKLQITLIIKSIVLISLIGGFLFFNHNTSKELKKLDRKEKKSFRSVRNTKSQIDQFNAKTDDIEKALKTWELIEEKEEHNDFQGLQIGYAKNIIDILKNKHEINKLDITLSKPVMLKGKNKGIKMGIESSEMEIKLRCYTDTQVFYFVFDLLTMLPGYPKITDFSLKKVYDINKDSLFRIAKDPKFSPVLADMKITWNDLKSLK